MTNRSINHCHTELRKIINKRLKDGKIFIFGCSKASVSYWENILSLHFPNAKIEQHEEGLRIW